VSTRAGRLLRGLSGLLAGGLVILLVTLGVAWYVADQAGSSGPGAQTLVWHAVAAVAAVIAQRYADRHRDTRGVLAAGAVIVIAAVLLTVEWLA
jgi:glucose-6-phosphate-specific signal transduction histidine kinase